MEIGIGSRVKHAEFGVGVVIQVTTEELIITFVNYGVKEIGHIYADDELEVLEKAPPIKNTVSLADVEYTLMKLLEGVTDELTVTDLGGKWTGGKLIFQPENPELKPYELPIETFFHKIVMVRDRLRVMEQRINSSDLGDEDKVNLQQYITRIYGSLTSFNVLFKSKEDGFTGVSG
ncbi:MAG: hypothetical protein ABJG41_06840 [Cyclobacteriaceae bacterium]